LQGIIVQITSPRPPPQQLLPRDPNTTGGGCNAEEEAHFPDYGQTEGIPYYWIVLKMHFFFLLIIKSQNFDKKKILNGNFF
jgi:hypothetical protein